jgi:hypothetical protein
LREVCAVLTCDAGDDGCFHFFTHAKSTY